MSEEMRVLYGASLQIPICIGSVSLPLPYVSQLESAALESADHAMWASSSNTATTAPGTATTPSSSSAFSARKRSRSTAEADETERTADGLISRRYTHRRYCYIRDGGEMSYDAFCRWLIHHDTAATGRRTGSPSGGAGEATAACAEEGMLAARPDNMALRTVSDTEEAALLAVVRDRPPSLFYGLVDRIEFLVPTSFPEPRRVVRRAPFVIEDLCWAEHLIELHVHFLPSLAIPPVMLLHQAILERRVPSAPLPALRTDTFEQARVPATVMHAFTPAPPRPSSASSSSTAAAPSKSHDDEKDEEEAREGLWTLVQCATVSERKDTIRLLNPTTHVAACVRLMDAKMADEDVIAPLYHFFLAQFHGCPAPETEELDATQPLLSDRKEAPEDAVPVCLQAVPAYYTRVLGRRGADRPTALDLVAGSGDEVSLDTRTHSGDETVEKKKDATSGSAARNADEPTEAKKAGGAEPDEEDDENGAVTSWTRSPTMTSSLRHYHHAWDLPFEAAVFAYVTQRRRREAEGTITALAAQLRTEQENLVRHLRALVETRLPASVHALHKELDAAYCHCVSLANTATPAAKKEEAETGQRSDVNGAGHALPH